MKRNVILIGSLILLILAGAYGCRFAHRRYKEKMESARLKEQSWQNRPGRMGRRDFAMQRGGMYGHRGDMQFGPRRGRGGENMRGFGMRGGRGMGMGMGMGMGPGGPMQMNPMGPGPMGRGLMPDRIPGLTDKQRKEIMDLRDKQQIEMLKFRQETTAKLESMREANRKQILNLLTDDQKKALQSGPAAINKVPATPK